jgi:hypothetical protein
LLDEWMVMGNGTYILSKFRLQQHLMLMVFIEEVLGFSNLYTDLNWLWSGLKVGPSSSIDLIQ